MQRLRWVTSSLRSSDGPLGLLSQRLQSRPGSAGCIAGLLRRGAPPARGTRCCTPWGRATGHPAGHRILPACVFRLLPTVQHGRARGKKCFPLFSLSTFSPVYLQTLPACSCPVSPARILRAPPRALPTLLPRLQGIALWSDAPWGCCLFPPLPLQIVISASLAFFSLALRGCLPLAVTFCPAPSALPEVHFSLLSHVAAAAPKAPAGCRGGSRGPWPLSSPCYGSGIHLLPAALCTSSVRF